MDRTQEQAASRVIADLVENGGGTYEQGTLLPFRPTSGYAVGIGGIHLPATAVTPEAVVWAMKAAASEYATYYVGTWLNDAVVYFDAVLYFGPERREAAMQAGRDAGQMAIYSFAETEALTLVEGIE